MSKRFEGKVAVITGGNSGMGLATAQRFVEEGAKVVITGRRQAELDAAVKQIGGNVIGVQGDVANLKDLDRLYETVKQKYRHIDILFANAGVGDFLPLGMITEEHFDKVFNINVRGLLFTVQKALPLFKDGGSIIVNSSIANMKGMGAMSVYAASKAAVRSFARGWTVDLKERKIRVNSISPGPIDTPIMGKAGLSEEQVQGFKSMITSQVPMGHMGRSLDIANTVLFLASEESAFITGVDLAVDGGMAQI
jgi:NAD(P)-dependent dehydrogenase (short-subunit alcohol dehydrogenase family)